MTVYFLFSPALNYIGEKKLKEGRSGKNEEKGKKKKWVTKGKKKKEKRKDT